MYSQSNQIQRVRINFTSPVNSVRQLLLGFTPNDAATDGFDYGYDAPNPDNFPNDLNWIINNNRYVIQGVGSFSNSKNYPLGLFLSDEGTISISLHSLENFETNVNVYLYDAVLNQHTLLNETNFTGNFTQGDYLDRFFITFSNVNYPEALSLEEHKTNQISLDYYRSTKTLILKNSNNSVYLQEIELFDLSGKKIFSQKLQNVTSFQLENYNKIPNAICRVKTNIGHVSKLLIL